jgi:hypothetical protein
MSEKDTFFQINYHKRSRYYFDKLIAPHDIEIDHELIEIYN